VRATLLIHLGEEEGFSGVIAGLEVLGPELSFLLEKNYQVFLLKT
jgi:hypothetical protein